MLSNEQKVSLKAGRNVLLGDLEHPNKMPFHGLLTWFNRPSDKPVGGAGGKKVIIPAEYGIPALASLKGMAVNFDSVWMDKHVTTHKIGIIEGAEAGEPEKDGGIPVYVSGYIYAHDFPEEAFEIKQNQKDLGFSYETIDTPVLDSIHEGELVLLASGDVVFSGAAILLKEKGAYTNTSLAAQADSKETEVDEVDIDAIVVAVIAALEAKYELQAKANQEVMQEMVSEMVSDHVETEAKMQDMVDGLCAEAEVTEEAKADEVKEELQAEAEPAAQDEAKEEVKDITDPAVEDKVEGTVAETELKAEAEEVVEEKPAEEVVDFKAQAEDLKAQLDAVNAELEKIKVDLKAEAEAKEMNSHKGYTYPLTLAAKFNLQAESDDYDTQIKAVDAREDLDIDQKFALKVELRDKKMKSVK